MATNPRNRNKVDKILYLESFRGIAALIVVMLHFNVDSVFNNRATENGWLMVDFFFVLSGFVIALNYQQKIKSLSDIFTFQLKRFLRLYPLHILMLLAFLMVEISKFIAETNLGLVANNPAFSTNNSLSFIQNVFLLQNLTNEVLTWNEPSWSISSEFYTYLLFAIVVLITIHKKIGLYVISVLIIILSFYFLRSHSMKAQYGFVRCLFSFFMGVMVFNVYQKRSRFIIPNVVSYIILVLSIYLICFSESNNKIGINIYVPFVFATLILSLVMSSGTNLIKSALNKSYLVYLGTISYGIYMIHALVWWIFTQIFRFIFHLPTYVDGNGNVKIVFDNFLISNFSMVLGICLIIFLASLSYKFVEMPINSFRHKIGEFNINKVKIFRLN